MDNNITSKQRKFIQSTVVDYYCDFGRDFPWRNQFNGPYHILIAELLLKRTTAQAVGRIFPKIINNYPAIDDLHGAKKKDLQSIIEPLGLVNQRYAILKSAASYISNLSKFPDSLPELIKIPGVGEYTARAILCFAYKKPSAIVDSNVIRIYNRLFFSLFKEGVLSDFQELADYLLPPRKHQEYNFGLLDITSEYCRPVYLRCKECPLTDLCEFESIASEELGRVAEGLPKELRDLRKRKDISQVKLASLSGVSKRTIVNIEKGRSTPTSKTLEKLSKVLGEDLSKLR